MTCDQCVMTSSCPECSDSCCEDLVSAVSSAVWCARDLVDYESEERRGLSVKMY